jgi:hypothetical protein
MRERTPQEKKSLSLAKDRRNVYGEAPHGAWKSIPLRKKLRNRANRSRSRIEAAFRTYTVGRRRSGCNRVIDARQSSAALEQISRRPAGRRHRQKAMAESDAEVHTHSYSHRQATRTLVGQPCSHGHRSALNRTIGRYIGPFRHTKFLNRLACSSNLVARLYV